MLPKIISKDPLKNEKKIFNFETKEKKLNNFLVKYQEKNVYKNKIIEDFKNTIISQISQIDIESKKEVKMMIKFNKLLFKNLKKNKDLIKEEDIKNLKEVLEVNNRVLKELNKTREKLNKEKSKIESRYKKFNKINAVFSGLLGFLFSGWGSGIGAAIGGFTYKAISGLINRRKELKIKENELKLNYLRDEQFKKEQEKEKERKKEIQKTVKQPIFIKKQQYPEETFPLQTTKNQPLSSTTVIESKPNINFDLKPVLKIENILKNIEKDIKNILQIFKFFNNIKQIKFDFSNNIQNNLKKIIFSLKNKLFIEPLNKVKEIYNNLKNKLFIEPLNKVKEIYNNLKNKLFIEPLNKAQKIYNNLKNKLFIEPLNKAQKIYNNLKNKLFIEPLNKIKGLYNNLKNKLFIEPLNKIKGLYNNLKNKLFIEPLNKAKKICGDLKNKLFIGPLNKVKELYGDLKNKLFIKFSNKTRESTEKFKQVKEKINEKRKQISEQIFQKSLFKELFSIKNIFSKISKSIKFMKDIFLTAIIPLLVIAIGTLGGISKLSDKNVYKNILGKAKTTSDKILSKIYKFFRGFLDYTIFLPFKAFGLDLSEIISKRSKLTGKILGEKIFGPILIFENEIYTFLNINFRKIKNFVVKIIKSISNFFKNIYDTILNVYNFIKDKMDKFFDIIKKIKNFIFGDDEEEEKRKKEKTKPNEEEEERKKEKSKPTKQKPEFQPKNNKYREIQEKTAELNKSRIPNKPVVINNYYNNVVKNDTYNHMYQPVDFVPSKES